MVFAGVSGSAVADASAIGSVMIPAMKQERYPPAYAAAVTAASATIGPVIPPSIPLVVFGLSAGASIGKLFVAGIIPGLAMGLFLITASVIISRVRRYPAGKWQGFGEIAASAMGSLIALSLPVLVVAGLVTGVATATEIGAVAAAYAIVIATLIYRELSLTGLWDALCRAALDSCKVLVILAVAGIFSWIVANMGLAREISALVANASGDPLVVLSLIALLLLALGMVMEPVTLLVVVVPLLVPTALAVGIDVIQLGVVTVLATLIGLVTPPVGFLIYLASAQANCSAVAVVRELAPFLGALFVLMVCLIVFPSWTLWLPAIFF
jgi:tripartite ATP-independent transporter DctM subunit